MSQLDEHTLIKVAGDMGLNTIFSELEADVRSYCRTFPAMFTTANGATLCDQAGRSYIDFLSGAGALNYGHNPPAIKNSIIDYLHRDGIIQSLDLHTEAKAEFLTALRDIILRPRGLDYKVAFPGPNGTNAVELALKIARNAMGRETIVAFSGGFHGMTLGALAATGSRSKRNAAGTSLPGVIRAPYDGYIPGVDTADYLDKLLDDPGSGVDLPAAIILETIQGEGGLNAASSNWLKKVRAICNQRDVLMIVDDVQAGCGRTGSFFSFETLGFVPDIVCLSKSLGGMGLPMSLVLLKPELDVLRPGEHNGTFRGHNLAFVAAAAALSIWKDPLFGDEILESASVIQAWYQKMHDRYSDLNMELRGRGMMLGLRFSDPNLAKQLAMQGFKEDVIAETTGARDEILKILPPLTISHDELTQGLGCLEQAINTVAKTGIKPVCATAGK